MICSQYFYNKLKMTNCNQLKKITCHIYKICYKIIVKRLETQHQLNKYIKVHVILHQFILFHLTMKRRLSFVFIICVALYLFGQVLFLYLSFGLIYIYLGNFLFNLQWAKNLEGSNFTWSGLKFFLGWSRTFSG